MKKRAEAELRWFRIEEGGRQILPTGPRFVTVARFERQERLSGDDWSLVITFTTNPNAERCHRAQVEFLVEAAPHALLQPGTRFWLMEGARTVAEGIITF